MTELISEFAEIQNSLKTQDRKEIEEILKYRAAHQEKENEFKSLKCNFIETGSIKPICEIDSPCEEIFEFWQTNRNWSII